MLVEVAEARLLPAAECVIGKRHRDGEIHSHHADVHAAGEVARGVAVAGEDRDPVAVVVLRGQPHGLLVVLGAHDREHRPENLFLVDAHMRLDLVEQAAAHEKPALVALQLEAAPVDLELGALLYAELDIASHLVEMRAADQRTVIGLCVAREADLETFHPRDELFEQGVRGLAADRHRHRYGHAPLARRAVAGTDQGIDGLVQIRIGHDDHVVLGAAKALHALSLGAAGRINVLGHGRGAHEADGPDARVGQQRFHRLPAAIDHIEHPGRQPGLDQQLGEPHRHRRVALRRLEDECIAAGECGRELPHRNHGRKVEGRDAGDHPERLAHGVEVDAGAGAFGELALDEVGNAARELGDLEAALDVAARIGERFAVLAGEELGELVELPLHELEKLEQDARAPLRVGRGPGRLGGLRHRDRALDFRSVRKVDLGLHLAGVRIEDLAGAAGCARDLLPADEMPDQTHRRLRCTPSSCAPSG